MLLLKTHLPSDGSGRRGHCGLDGGVGGGDGGGAESGRCPGGISAQVVVVQFAQNGGAGKPCSPAGCSIVLSKRSCVFGTGSHAYRTAATRVVAWLRVVQAGKFTVIIDGLPPETVSEKRERERERELERETLSLRP